PQEMDTVRETQFACQLLELLPARAVTAQQEFEVISVLAEKTHGTNENREPFLGRQSRRTEQSFDLLSGRTIAISADGHSAVHDLESIDILGLRKHHQLTAAKVADRAREPGSQHLLVDPG